MVYEAGVSLGWILASVVFWPALTLTGLILSFKIDYFSKKI
jgi:hypothetical protein